MNNKGVSVSRAKFVANKTVFLGSSLIMAVVLALALAVPQQFNDFLEIVKNIILHNFDWFYMLAVAGFLVFCIAVALSSYGLIKLGPDHIQPDFNNLSWFAMLFSAGMGIGLVFFGVAEPVMHYVQPPVGVGQTTAAASQALSITFFHWGLHAWAIYAIVGLLLAYYSFRQGLPLSLRSSLYPVIGDKIHGKVGDAVDIVAVISTICGIATTLAAGVTQVNRGLNYLFDVPYNSTIQVVLIIAITAIATLSVISGLNAGLRRLSELNLILAILLLLFVFVVGPTASLLQLFVQNIGSYLSGIVERTFNLYAYEPSGWFGGWTLFYWGWWIAWSPFVGMFIARISRGRTIREFIFGVLFVPAGFCFLWMTVFGNTAIGIDAADATYGVISSATQTNVEFAIFKFFENLPLTTITSTLSILLVVVFFVTSADSGALVLDIITAGGKKKTPVWQRVFWASITGVVAMVLLLAGGLEVLQIAALTTALPFSIIILFACYGLLQSLRLEKARQYAHAISPGYSAGGINVSWRKRLRSIVSMPTNNKAKSFIANSVIPAVNQVVEEFKKQGLDVKPQKSDEIVSLVINHGDEPDFSYAVHIKGYIMPGFAITSYTLAGEEQEKYYRAEVYLSEGGQDYDIMGYTVDEIISDILTQYDKHAHFLHLIR